MRLSVYKSIYLLLSVLALSACSSDDNEETIIDVEEPVQIVEPIVIYELLQVTSQNEIVVWQSEDITQEEFDAIVPAERWIKNGPRTLDSSTSLYLRSPDAAEDGPLEEAEHFGHIWQQNAKVVAFNFDVDGQSVLPGNLVEKYHHVTFSENSTLHVLISPEGEQYIRISTAANRSEETPSVPETWQTGEYVVPQTLTYELPNPTSGILLDNGDSFQGPITPISADELINLAYGNTPVAVTSESPIELTPAICDDPSNLALIEDYLDDAFTDPPYGQYNDEQIQKMLENPTVGPFYMFNLIRFRDQALYTDGRETDLTGREANALYSPVEYIEDIGARVIFNGDIGGTLAGVEGDFDQVAIVEYPCPLALMSMSVHPGFKEQLAHKHAGVEHSYVMMTYAQVLEEFEIPASSFAPSEGDPAFEHIQVFRYFDKGQYDEASDEPQRTGAEAMAVYAENIKDPKANVGIYPKLRVEVDGVLIGDGSEWSSVWIDYIPSRSAFEALSTDSDFQAAQYHRAAAIDSEYGYVIQPAISISPAPFGRGALYCEMMLVRQNEGQLNVDLWGTQGLSYCQQTSVDALDLAAISEQYGAVQASIEGPRIWLVDSTTTAQPGEHTNVFGEIAMSKRFTVQIVPDNTGDDENPPYVETTVAQSASYTYLHGERIFTLIAPDGAEYVMLSASLAEKADLTIADLPDLRPMMDLPEGWEYVPQILEQDLILTVSGEAILVQDELDNTYLKNTASE